MRQDKQHDMLEWQSSQGILHHLPGEYHQLPMHAVIRTPGLEHMPERVPERMSEHVNIHIYTHVYPYTYTYTHMYIDIYLYVCIYACITIYVYDIIICMTIKKYV